MALKLSPSSRSVCQSNAVLRLKIAQQPLLKISMRTLQQVNENVENLHHAYNITQISILDSHYPGPKQGEGKHNCSLFLLKFFLLPVRCFTQLNKTSLWNPPLSIKSSPLYQACLEIKSPRGLERIYSIYHSAEFSCQVIIIFVFYSLPSTRCRRLEDYVNIASVRWCMLFYCIVLPWGM